MGKGMWKNDRWTVVFLRDLRTGSPFGNILYFNKADFKFLFGDLQTYVFYTESGREWVNNFCKNCATTVYCNLEIRKDHIGVPGGLFDPPNFQYNISKTP